MRIKDLRLRFSVWDDIRGIGVRDQNDLWVSTIRWGKRFKRTKPQAIAIAKRLCDRFNAGQGEK
jgi:hypothetical protein